MRTHAGKDTHSLYLLQDMRQVEEAPARDKGAWPPYKQRHDGLAVWCPFCGLVTPYGRKRTVQPWTCVARQRECTIALLLWP